MTKEQMEVFQWLRDNNALSKTVTLVLVARDGRALVTGAILTEVSNCGDDYHPGVEMRIQSTGKVVMQEKP